MRDFVPAGARETSIEIAEENRKARIAACQAGIARSARLRQSPLQALRHFQGGGAGISPVRHDSWFPGLHRWPCPGEETDALRGATRALPVVVAVAVVAVAGATARCARARV